MSAVIIPMQPPSPVDEYLAHGWKLCHVPEGSKGVNTPNWNIEANALTEPPQSGGVGLLHAYSNTMAFDIDDGEATRAWFKERNIDIKPWFLAADSVGIDSGNPNHAKLLFKLPPFIGPMPSKSVKIDKKTIFELRCATADGLSVMDVLPPARHPTSGKNYSWTGKGSWQNLPLIPDALLGVWSLLLNEKRDHTPSGATTLENLDEVKSALAAIPASVCHDDWLTCLMALHSTKHPDAYEVARTWSMSCAEKWCGDNTFSTRWRSFSEKENGITIASLFHHAKENGWVSPPVDVTRLFGDVAGAAGDAPPYVHPLLRYETGYSNEGTEFVIDGVVAEGPVILPADRGLGKTTAIVSLACKVAHLCPENDPLRPTIQRNVVYLTEDPKQVQRILYAMAGENQFGLDGDTFEERFDEAKSRIKIVPTVRLTPEVIVRVADEYNKTLKVPNERNGVRYDAPPWVIFDTTSASIDLEEENSNSEIGKAVALMKSEFYLKREIPFLLVAHTAKAMKHADVSKLSARGGGAWEADVYQVIYMSTDDDGGRFLEIGTPNAKKRFSPKFYSIAIGGHRKECVVTNRFKEITTEWITWASLTPMTSEEVTGIKEKSEEVSEITREDRAIRRMVSRIEKYLETEPDFRGSTNALNSRITGTRSIKLRAIDQMVKAGLLIETEPDEEDGQKVLSVAKREVKE